MKLSEYLKPIILRAPKRRKGPKNCSCGLPVHGKGLCKRCYQKEYHKTVKWREYDLSYRKKYISSIFLHTDLEQGYCLIEIIRYNQNSGSIYIFSNFVRNKSRSNE